MRLLLASAVTVLGLSGFTSCDNDNDNEAEAVALTALESGGYVANVSSALLSEDDNFDIYFCDYYYYILNETGDAIDHEGDVEIYSTDDILNIWEDWPNGFNDVDIMTAGTVNPGYVVEGQTYVLNEYDSDVVAGSMTINVIDTFDCSTLPMPVIIPE